MDLKGHLYHGMSMEVIVTIVSKLVYNLFRGLITCIYRGYNLVTKYHGHPSRRMFLFFFRFSDSEDKPRTWVLQ